MKKTNYKLLLGGAPAPLCCTGKNLTWSILSLFGSEFTILQNLTQCDERKLLLWRWLPFRRIVAVGGRGKRVGRTAEVNMVITDARWISMKDRGRSVKRYVEVIFSCVTWILCRFSVRRKTHGQCWRGRLQHKRGFSRWLKYLANIDSKLKIFGKYWQSAHIRPASFTNRGTGASNESNMCLTLFCFWSE